MAEIKVEPKRGGLGWLWAIIILVLIALVLWYVYNNRRTAAGTTTPAADTGRTSMIEHHPAPAPNLLTWDVAYA